MNTDLIRTWLDLPPGPWPPADRTLLGLDPGADAAAAERRALVLMGRLRPHQLVHPDLVTEGMNRLAQALLAVTAQGPAKQENAPSPALPEVDLQAVEFDATPTSTEEPAAVAVAADEPAPAPRLRVVAAPPAAPVARTVAPAVDAVEVPRPPDPVVGRSPSDRRAAYRELAALRGLRRAWEKLLPSFADPSESLPSAGGVFEFLEANDAVRTALAHPGLPRDLLPAAAPRCAAILAQPLALAVFRSLTATQRRTVAHEWAVGQAAIEGRLGGLRAALRASRPRATFRARASAGCAALERNPEWLLAAVSATAVTLAVVRVVAR